MERSRKSMAVLALAATIVGGTALARASAGPVATPFAWTLARSPHFEVYTDAGSEQAIAAAKHFEELRSFFAVHGLVELKAADERGEAKRGPVRVVAFSSRDEYTKYQLRAGADAYYTGTSARDYIVMPLARGNALSVPAHEYTHVLIGRAGMHLPAWLNEGLAEVFSTVAVAGKQTEFGGAPAARVQTLQKETWLSAAELFGRRPETGTRATATATPVFYAESWAVVDMLAAAPEYALRFDELISRVRSGEIASDAALAEVYGQPASVILAAAQKWVRNHRSPKRLLPSVASQTAPVQVQDVPQRATQAVLAGLLMANGNDAGAERMYQELLHQSPDDPEVLAALGTLALRAGDRQGATTYWHRALDNGLADADVCYRYAVVADQLNLPPGEIEPALQRALQVRPDYEEARYKLASLQSNRGDYEDAVTNLRVMNPPTGKRVFSYWSALAYALGELGKRDEAESAAQQAMKFAVSAEDRARVAQIAYMARTDLAVRFTRAPDGSLRGSTTRVLHGTSDFNPFVEEQDQMATVTGTLREVQCSDGKLTGFVVNSGTGTLLLRVPDPQHVIVENGRSEFTCGPQENQFVRVQYARTERADTGILRGLAFR